MKSDRVDRGFVYRIKVHGPGGGLQGGLKIDQAIRVGELPKYVVLTPDETRLLVTNWCSYDVSVVDVATAREIDRLPGGYHPRGITVDSASKFAYVAPIENSYLLRLNLETGGVRRINHVGAGPRDGVIDPTDTYLYVTLDRGRGVAKVDIASGDVVDYVRTRRSPRSMWLSPDGTALWVTNWESASLSKIRTSNMTVVQHLDTGRHPIGVTYDIDTQQVWVSMYPGSIRVYQESLPNP